VQDLGSDAHRALIGHAIAHYRGDERILAVAVFASVATGAWHPLSDVDMDIVTGDEVVIAPGAEVAALFGARAAIVITEQDSADVVLGSLEELSIRWHPLAGTSPFIAASVRVAAGTLSTAQVAAAGEANWAAPEPGRHLDAMVRDAIGAWKYLQRGRAWEAVRAVERARASLVRLRGRRDGLRLDPGDPGDALARVIAEAAADFDFGPRRAGLLARIGIDASGGLSHASRGLGAAT
jgi:hypothetical protein